MAQIPTLIEPPKEKRKGKVISRAVSFMYEPPPGYLDFKKKEQKEEQTKQKEEEDKKAKDDAFNSKVDPFHYEELGKRFPFLKNAPTSDESARHRTIRHNPMGILVKNVRCARCGNYGHRSGERECPMLNARTLNDAQRQIREDPMTFMKPEIYLSDKLVLTRGQENEIHGGFSKDDPLQQILNNEEDDKKKGKQKEKSDDSDEEEITGLEEEFLQSLSEKEMKTLLKHYKKEQKKTKKNAKKKKKEKSKGKKRKTRSSSSSVSPTRKKNKNKN